MKSQTFREGHLTFILLEGSDREYVIEDDDDVLGRVIRIQPYGVQSFWHAIDPTGRIVGRYMDRVLAANALTRGERR